ncbi:magnesium-protoporphyrin IX monomethyl ester (oxidative) cyclase [Pannus brasiliensis CCIBt3594]|uniref:Magnesium-protoporphyrin IX monomethyl ester [oxidative] cyclase n=1 Tax=Pannus brasiliensis CCIBt3594 TaxID=1427578 RepID=A0AAW9QQZ8_9CHRO
MVTTVERPSEKKAVLRETILSPRFYTTDFEAAANFDLSLQETEIQAMLAEMRTDYNRDHFTRNEAFANYIPNLNEKERQAFVDYLERSCISEFSGFLLFKELSRQLKNRNPILAEMFQLMARDEARHAGFLNKAMADFNITLDLGKITKTRQYTFFPLEWVLYTVYLSEKIGYWRYILIFRHLEQHPEHKFNPLFNYFESWCQDENRHGDIFKALIRANPKLWNNWKSRLWSRFFLLSVFATHSLTVRERADFYDALGLDAREFDAEVIRQTNDTSARAFPTILNVDHPEFFPRLERCSERNFQMKAIDESNAPKWLKKLRKLPLQLGIVGDLLKLYLIPAIDAEATRETVR